MGHLPASSPGNKTPHNKLTVMNIKKYLEEVAAEMRKVSWPKRQELLSNTIVTLVATLFISLFIYAADWLISGVLDFLYA